mgnify:CR=1 FL=1
MAVHAYGSFAQWYSEGYLAHYVRTMKSAGGIVHLLEAAQPAGDMSDPAVPDIVLYQDIHGNTRVSGDMGGGRFDGTSEKGSFFLSAPDFANTVLVDAAHELRSVSFPLSQWQPLLDEAIDGPFSLDYQRLCMGAFASPPIRTAFRKLWALSEDEGALSRLLARSAGCEILAELCKLGGAPIAPAKGGLSLWAERRCLELMRERLSEDISLDELAAEARLSAFHFARMFRQSIGVPPRVYLTRLRVEKACELLEQTDLPITEIATEVGYSSSQVLARVFLKHMHLSPSDYRKAVRDPARTANSQEAPNIPNALSTVQR